eukprot:970319-Ditylum_brightwellii.AAC.1
MGRCNQWARNVLKQNVRAIRRLHWIKEVDETFWIKTDSKSGRNKELMRGRLFNTNSIPRPLKKKISRNARNMKKKNQEKFGIAIPRNVKEALIFDSLNGNNFWVEAILKEMKALDHLDVFESHKSSVRMDKKDGWQYAPMHMIFDIKHDL